MSQENVEVLRGIFDGWAAGDFSAGVDELDRHVTFVVSRDFPAFGVFVGLAGTRDFMRDFLAQWAQTTIEQKHLQAVGDTVLAHVSSTARAGRVGSKPTSGSSCCSPSEEARSSESRP